MCMCVFLLKYLRYYSSKVEYTRHALICDTWHTTRDMRHATCYTRHATRNRFHATCDTRDKRYAARETLHTTRGAQNAICGCTFATGLCRLSSVARVAFRLSRGAYRVSRAACLVSHVRRVLHVAYRVYSTLVAQ